MALGNITEILLGSSEIPPEIQSYWLVLGLKFSEKFAPEYVPRHLMLLSRQYRTKKQVLSLARIKIVHVR